MAEESKSIPIREEDLPLHVEKLILADDAFNERIERLEKKVDRIDEIAEDVKKILDLFRTSKSVVAAIKWLLGIGTALAVIWAAVHGKISG